MANPWLVLRIGYGMGHPESRDPSKHPLRFRHRESEAAEHGKSVGLSDVLSEYQRIELRNIIFTQTFDRMSHAGSAKISLVKNWSRSRRARMIARSVGASTIRSASSSFSAPLPLNSGWSCCG